MAVYPPPLYTLGKKRNANNLRNSSCLAWQGGYCSYIANACITQKCFERKHTVPPSPATVAASAVLQPEVHQDRFCRVKPPSKAPQVMGREKTSCRIPALWQTHPNRAAPATFKPEAGNFFAWVGESLTEQSQGVKRQDCSGSIRCLEMLMGRKPTQRRQSKGEVRGQGEQLGGLAVFL